MTTSPSPLDYGRPPFRRGRRVVVGAVTVAALVLVIGWLARPAVNRQWARHTARRQAAADLARGLALQQQCLVHDEPADQIVFSNRQGDRDAMSVPGRWVWGGDSNTARSVLGDWEQLLEAQGLSSYDPGVVRGTVFVHGRHAAGQSERLVAVDVQGYGGAVFSVTVIVPGSQQFRSPARVRVPVLHTFVFDDGFRVYAGQPDPADPAAFTIRCVRPGDGKPSSADVETVRGRLQPDDTVTLEPPPGHYLPQGYWELLSPNGNPLTPWDSPLRKVYGGGPRVPATRP